MQSDPKVTAFAGRHSDTAAKLICQKEDKWMKKRAGQQKRDYEGSNFEIGPSD